MTKHKLLIGNIHSTVEAEERGAILKFRELIPKLTPGEATALALVLIHSHSLPIGRRIGITAIQAFGQDLASAVLQVPMLSRTSKLVIAIELLEAQIERDTPPEEEEEEED